MRTLKIGDLEIRGPAVQAALSGYSDAAMRRVARAHGAPYCINEVVLDRDVVRAGKIQRRVLDVEAGDHPVGGQLMGADPTTFGQAARMLVDAGYDVVDINFGCPVPKVLGRCRGGYLLSEPETALDIVDRVLDAVAGDVPVSVKMRRGMDDGQEAERAFLTILDGAVERGVDAVTLHPRTVQQRYVGPSDWAVLKRIKERVGEVTLLGSGDLFTAFDVIRMLEETGVDGVTVARGAIGNPFVFDQVHALLEGRRPLPPSLGEQRDAIAMHVAASIEEHGPKRGLSRARTHAIKYAALHPDAVAVRDAFVKVRVPEEFEVVFAGHYPTQRADERAESLEQLAGRASELKNCSVGA